VPPTHTCAVEKLDGACRGWALEAGTDPLLRQPIDYVEIDAETALRAAEYALRAQTDH
jgi:hypothetical protein